MFSNKTPQISVNLDYTIYTSYAMLSSGIPWNMPRITCIFHIHTGLQAGVCIRRKYKRQVAYSMVSLEKALHNYFNYPMPKSSENLREFPKTSKTLQTRY